MVEHSFPWGALFLPVQARGRHLRHPPAFGAIHQADDVLLAVGRGHLAAQQALEAALDEDATANRRLEHEVEGTVIRAGALEKSNISIVTEMVNMIAIQRQYESNQKVITTFDESLDIAVNQLGRL